MRELQRNQECVLSRLEESVRRREEEWSRQHTHTVRGLQSELQVTLTYTHTHPWGVSAPRVRQSCRPAATEAL